MNSPRQRGGFGGFLHALIAGLQWKLLLVWLLLMLIPVAIAAWPMGATLGSLLDHSAHSESWARAFNGLAMGDTIMQLVKAMPAISAAAMAGALVSVLLAPWLTGMIITSVRSPARPGFGALMHGGLHEYWRMVRVWLWSLVGWAIAIAIGSVLLGMAHDHADRAVLQSSADLWNHVALGVFIALLVLAHAVAESSRAQFGADGKLGSATRAWLRGLKDVFRRPLSTLGVYIVVSVIGYILVLVFGMLRMRTPAVGAAGVVLAWVLAELVVLSLAWMRIARLHALAAVAGTRRKRARFGAEPSVV